MEEIHITNRKMYFYTEGWRMPRIKITQTQINKYEFTSCGIKYFARVVSDSDKSGCENSDRCVCDSKYGCKLCGAVGRAIKYNLFRRSGNEEYIYFFIKKRRLKKESIK